MAPDPSDQPTDATVEREPISFVIRFWVEAPEPQQHAIWRAHITHVASRERQSFTDLYLMVDFIVRYLETANARVPLRWRMRRRYYAIRRRMLRRGT